MSDLLENLDLRNLCHLSSKKIKSYCGIGHPNKVQVKNYKRKMGQWINDNESVYVREDLEFRKNLTISNNQSVRR